MWSNIISFYIFFKDTGKKIGWKNHTNVKDMSFLLVLYEMYLIDFED